MVGVLFFPGGVQHFLSFSPSLPLSPSHSPSLTPHSLWGILHILDAKRPNVPQRLLLSPRIGTRLLVCLVTKSKPHDIHQSASVLRNDGYTQFPGRQHVAFQGSRYSQSRRYPRLWMFSPCGFASGNVRLHCTHFEKVWGESGL